MGIQAEKMKMRLLIICLLWPVCKALLSDISQDAPFQAVELGHPATITCRFHSVVRTRIWYKLNAGKRLQLVASTDTLYNLTTFKEQSHHYLVKSDSISSHLTISTAMWEDTGTYYCGVINLYNVQFGSGTFLMVKGAKMISDSVVQQPESKSVQPGDSVTLSCSVHTGHCAAGHNGVMWLKNSGHSAPEMIYSSGNKNDTCQKAESGETTCVYNLLMTNLSSDDAGTYCCVVTSCGQILFGNGTRINIHKQSPTVIALMLSNIILGIVTLTLTWILCKSRRKDSTEATDGSCEGHQTSDGVIYAAVCSASGSLPARQATMKYSSDSVVYSDINYCQQN